MKQPPCAACGQGTSRSGFTIVTEELLPGLCWLFATRSRAGADQLAVGVALCKRPRTIAGRGKQPKDGPRPTLTVEPCCSISELELIKSLCVGLTIAKWFATDEEAESLDEVQSQINHIVVNTS